MKSPCEKCGKPVYSSRVSGILYRFCSGCLKVTGKCRCRRVEGLNG